ncbi:MAG: HAD family hydrolase [Hyphomicrobiales bacterium]|nr:MAG: HAD family hydrolase [Hyphomicrobiales bacterium]
MRRAVFLDRDGVINAANVRRGRPFPPRSVDELEILPGVREACDSLKSAGYLLIVVTNQPDIARKSASSSDVEAIHRELSRALPLDAIRVCPHDDIDACTCRKPKPGLLVDAARDLSVDLSASFMVGDRWRDIDAGTAAGCSTVFIDYGYTEPRPIAPDYTAKSLAEIVPILLHSERKRKAIGI